MNLPAELEGCAPVTLKVTGGLLVEVRKQRGGDPAMPAATDTLILDLVVPVAAPRRDESVKVRTETTVAA